VRWFVESRFDLLEHGTRALAAPRRMHFGVIRKWSDILATIDQREIYRSSPYAREPGQARMHGLLHSRHLSAYAVDSAYEWRKVSA
jgi:hypothetical protein